ncbi:hypothetical protein KVR01_009577 [Diaporthe batatas]|uniref:uncharacterized protein n=1 Tax=Diaporthe batatas TaxID=748121 RepID=UPI001D03625D|nr:uncharacterized protein KVR01_009577 [Diaporthe batatas]KAG8161313.1 hypothetical protein KVR01_009577 [Diaporthe batatas]
MAAFLNYFLVAASLTWPRLTPGCVSALTSDIACPRQVKTFTWGDYYPVETLEQVCTANCASALTGYEAKVAGACAAETYNLTEHNDAPVSLIPQTLHYYYNRSCITDGSRWCNNVAAQAAESTNPGAASEFMSRSRWREGAQFRWDVRRLTVFPRSERQGIDKCDDCLIKQMQFVAGSPMNGGVAFQDEYSSLTASCSKTGFPLASSTAPYPQPPVPTSDPATPVCTGATYQIQPGDTCQSISESQKVGTAWLLLDNGLQSFCANFPTSGSLCVQRSCKVYTVQANDTCASIADAQGVSEVMLGLWNPVLGSSCRTIGKSTGDSICISPPGGGSDWTEPTTTAQPTAGPSDIPAPVPANIAAGTNTHCSLFYEVQPEEYCNLIIMRYSVSMDDFMFLNQGVNSNCTNLFAYESYCMRPVGAIDSYPSHTGYVPPASATPTIPYDSLPKATYTPPAITGLPVVLPIANGTRKDCYLFVDGEQLQVSYDLASTVYTSTCHALAGGWGISLEELQNWNPSLDGKSSDCAPQNGYRYCLEAYDVSLVTPGSPQPTADVELPIRVFPPSPTTSQAPTTTAVSPPGPTQEGQPANCNKWHVVRDGDGCWAISNQYGITLETFYKW